MFGGRQRNIEVVFFLPFGPFAWLDYSASVLLKYNATYIAT